MAVTTASSLRVTGCQETWDESLSLRTTLAAFPFASYLTSFSALTPMSRIFVARGFSLASKNGAKSPATAV